MRRRSRELDVEGDEELVDEIVEELYPSKLLDALAEHRLWLHRRFERVPSYLWTAVLRDFVEGHELFSYGLAEEAWPYHLRLLKQPDVDPVALDQAAGWWDEARERVREIGTINCGLAERRRW